VIESWKQAQSAGTMTEGPRLDPRTMFEDVFATMPAHLLRQRLQLDQELLAAGADAQPT